MPDLSSAREPLVLNMSRLKSLNSYGIRSIIKLVREWGSRRCEFHECPSVFIDSVNVVRSILGTPPQAERVKSLCIPHYCDKDDTTFEILFQSSDISRGAAEISLAERPCPECGGPLELDCSLEEYLLFMNG